MVDDMHNLSAARVQEIEDAIMFGKPRDLALLVEDIASDDEFPAELHSDLESLHYFRVHYGQQGDLSDMEKKKVALMDAAWAMDVLNKLRARVDAFAKSA